MSAAGAELRQVTVVAVDMYGSTAIAARLGPERMRQLMLEMYEVCIDAVTRYEGRVTKYTGDGVLAQFGYPVAHEDDARRAVLAALAVLEAIDAKAPGWESRFGEQVLVRIGVDSGVAAVGPVDASPWSAEEVAGDPPNVASRVQAIAEPMTVRVTDATHRLIEGWFETVSVGAVELRNYPEPVGLHRVVGPTEAESRLEARVRPRPPLIGRDAELGVLRAAWNRVVATGERRIVLLTGEPGIGKSRLVGHVVGTVVATGASHVTLACSRLHQDSSLRPVASALRRFFRVFPDDGGSDALWLDAIRRRLEQLSNRRIPIAQAVPIYGWLLGIRSAVDLAPEELRRQAFDALVDLLEAMATSSKLLLCADDVDTADPSTVELLRALLARPPAPMLVILTGRGPLPSLGGSDDVLELAGLSAGEAVALVRAIAPDLDDDALDRIVARSDGVPLFLEEQARAAQETPGGPLAEPLELSMFLAARLDELDPELKRLVREISVGGEEVRLGVLRRLAEVGAERVDELVAELCRRRVLRQSGPAGEIVRFRHGLMREVAYASLLETRRAELHRRFADVLAELPPGVAAPEDLARHYGLAGDDEKAAHWWLEAGRLAAASGANAEAIELFRRSLSALGRLPDGPDRAHVELDVELGLGSALSTVDGYTAPDARASFDRAVELAESLADTTTILPALWGIWAYWFVLGEHEVAAGIADRCVRIAEQETADRRLRHAAAAIIGYSRLHMGELPGARSELQLAVEQVGAEPVADLPHDPGVVSQAALAAALWFLGEGRRSAEAAREALEMTAALDPADKRTALTECFVYCYLAWRAELDGDSATAIELSDRALAVAGARGYATWLAAATLHRSIAQCSLGQLDEGLPTLTATVDAWRSAGRDASGRQLHSVLMTPYFAGRLAEALIANGDVDEAAELLDQLLADTASNGERLWDVELLKLRATVARLREAPAEVIHGDLDAARSLAEEQSAMALLARLPAHAEIGPRTAP